MGHLVLQWWQDVGCELDDGGLQATHTQGLGGLESDETRTEHNGPASPVREFLEHDGVRHGAQGVDPG